jgi:transposase
MSVTTNPQRPRHHVGIDVSKERLDVCLMPDGQTFAVANDQEGIDSLIERLQQMRPELVVLEARAAATSARRPQP